MRVLHGLSGAAGQPFIISNAQRKLGIQSDTVLYGDSKFAFSSDLNLPFSDNPTRDFCRFLGKTSPNYDIYHNYFRPYFFSPGRIQRFPCALDLLALRALGKTLVFHYRGSEVRFHSDFKRFSPYNYVSENPNLLTANFPEEKARKLAEFVQTICQRVLVPDPELQSYVPHAKVVARALNLEEWPYIGIELRKKPLVVHAPSRRIVKGSHFIIDAVRSLQAEGLDFEFKLIENLPNQEAKKLYEQADIVIDQLRIGWYGVLAVEAMALGKPVITYIRDDLVHHFKEQMPVINANPENIKTKLKTLVTDFSLRKDMSARARKYCEETHDANLIAKQLINEYQQAQSDESKIDPAKLFEFLAWLYEPQHDGLIPSLDQFKHNAETYGVTRACKSVLGRVKRKIPLINQI